MQIDQRGKAKTMGCADKIVLNGTRRCTLPKEELNGTHGIHFSLINLVKSVMKT